MLTKSLFLLHLIAPIVCAQTIMSISEMQLPAEFGLDSSSTCTELVQVEGIVLASYEAFYSGSYSRLYIGDTQSSPYSGLLVYYPAPEYFNFSEGDKISVTGIVDEEYTTYNEETSNMTRIIPNNPISDVVLINQYQPLPEIELVDMWFLDHARHNEHIGEEYEGKLVEIQDAIVVDNSAPPSWRQFTVADNEGNETVIRTAAYTLGDYGRPPLGMFYESIKGVIYDGYGNYNLMPRSIDDLTMANNVCSYINIPSELDTISFTSEIPEEGLHYVFPFDIIGPFDSPESITFHLELVDGDRAWNYQLIDMDNFCRPIQPWENEFIIDINIEPYAYSNYAIEFISRSYDTATLKLDIIRNLCNQDTITTQFSTTLLQGENPCLNPLTAYPDIEILGSTVNSDNIIDGSLGDNLYIMNIDTPSYYKISLCSNATNYDTYLTLWQDCPIYDGILIAENDDFCGASSELSVELGIGDYWIVVGGFQGQGEYGLTISEVVNPNQVIELETFDYSGAQPPGWIIESVTRSHPWAPIQEFDGDWAIESSHSAFEPTFDEWLISPVYDLTWWENVIAGFTNTFTSASSEAAFRVSTNNGLSWSTINSWTESVDEASAQLVSDWVDGVSSVRFAFRFRSDFINGGSSWSVDDFFLDGIPKPPVATNPFPQQPPAPWSSGTGTIGCSWAQPNLIEGGSCQVRVDFNGDGDYLDGAEEEWVALDYQPDATEIEVFHGVTFSSIGIHKFEFRAKAVGGEWGYSGSANQDGIADDWFVVINGDVEPPDYANLIPSGQPNPSWSPELIVNACVMITDNASIDAATIKLRIDKDGDGAFDGLGEEWALLSGYVNSDTIEVCEVLEFVDEGEYSAQFGATDFSGNSSISDTLHIRIDTTPPTVSYLALIGNGSTSLNLAFSPTSELNFDCYELAISVDSLVDEGDFIWSSIQDPALGFMTTNQTTVEGLQPAARYWVGVRSKDLAGNVSDWSNIVIGITEGAKPIAVQDLGAEIELGGVLLSWSAPAEDVYGGTPVVVNNYLVHASQFSQFTPSQETLLGSTVTPNYFIPLEQLRTTQVFYRVVADGAGPGNGISGFTFVPAGSFLMGEAGIAEPVHNVQLTESFLIGTCEITNQEFVTALNWANANQLIDAIDIDNHRVYAYGKELCEINATNSEIYWNGVSFEVGSVGGGSFQSNDASTFPMLKVSWWGAAAYCDWRSQMEGLTPFYAGNWFSSPSHNPYDAIGYRLPTEAEWEYAARYNDGRNRSWGSAEPNCDLCNFYSCVGWSAPVGSYPNGASNLGILDLNGNVSEWTNDRYAIYDSISQTNPFGATSNMCVFRGGSSFTQAANVSTTLRGYYDPSTIYFQVGFRIMRY